MEKRCTCIREAYFKSHSRLCLGEMQPGFLYVYHFSKDLNDGVKTQNPLHGEFPFYNVYKTKDNKFLSLGIVEVKFWRELCKGLGREDLILKQFAQGEEREEVFKELQNEFITRNQKDWINYQRVNKRSCCMI